jgi:hypothetical protein
MTELALTLQVSADDAEEISDFVNPTYNYTLTTNNTSNIQLDFGPGNGEDVYYGGARFSNVTIPSGSIISSAVLNVSLLDLWDDGGGGYEYFLRVHGHKVANAGVFSTNDGPASRSPLTAATKVVTDVIESSSVELNIDVRDIVREIVGQESWASGNGMSFRLADEGNRGSPRPLKVGSFDSATKNMTLTINHFVPEAPDNTWWRHKLTESA